MGWNKENCKGTQEQRRERLANMSGPECAGLGWHVSSVCSTMRQLIGLLRELLVTAPTARFWTGCSHSSCTVFGTHVCWHWLVANVAFSCGISRNPKCNKQGLLMLLFQGGDLHDCHVVAAEGADLPPKTAADGSRVGSGLWLRFFLQSRHEQTEGGSGSYCCWSRGSF